MLAYHQHKLKAAEAQRRAAHERQVGQLQQPRQPMAKRKHLIFDWTVLRLGAVEIKMIVRRTGQAMRPADASEVGPRFA